MHTPGGTDHGRPIMIRTGASARSLGGHADVPPPLLVSCTGGGERGGSPYNCSGARRRAPPAWTPRKGPRALPMPQGFQRVGRAPRSRLEALRAALGAYFAICLAGQVVELLGLLVLVVQGSS